MGCVSQPRRGWRYAGAPVATSGVDALVVGRGASPGAASVPGPTRGERRGADAAGPGSTNTVDT
jgi:hypothetical protein